MNPTPSKQELDRFFALLAGWTDIQFEQHKENSHIYVDLNYISGIHPTRTPKTRSVIPSFSSSFDELYPFKLQLTEKQQYTYYDFLMKDLSNNDWDLAKVENGDMPAFIVRATPRQEALALYQTLTTP